MVKSTFQFRFLLIVVLCCVLCFSSCHIPLFSQSVFYDGDFITVDKIAEQVAQLIVEKDFEGLYTLLSDEAQASDDVEKGFAFCCSILSEEAAEIEHEARPVFEHIENQASWKRCDARYKITTVSGKVVYLVIAYWYYNESAPSLEGINCLRISEEVPDFFSLEQKYNNRAGIYNSAWDSAEES